MSGTPTCCLYSYSGSPKDVPIDRLFTANTKLLSPPAGVAGTGFILWQSPLTPNGTLADILPPSKHSRPKHSKSRSRISCSELGYSLTASQASEGGRERPSAGEGGLPAVVGTRPVSRKAETGQAPPSMLLPAVAGDLTTFSGSPHHG
jgi:hypothetical protein